MSRASRQPPVAVIPGPVVEAITGPLCLYAADWWRATDSDNSQDTHLFPDVLVSAFRSAKAGTLCDGPWHQQLRVPLSAMLCSVHRIGWAFTNPTSLLTRRRQHNFAALRPRRRHAFVRQWRCSPSAMGWGASGIPRSSLEQTSLTPEFIDESIKALWRERSCQRSKKHFCGDSWLAVNGRARRSKLQDITSTLRVPCAVKELTHHSSCLRLGIAGTKLVGVALGGWI